MPRRDLLELLADRPIYHPTRIERIDWVADRLTVSVCGSPWWEGPYDPGRPDGEMSLIFDGVVDGRLLIGAHDPDFDKALEEFEVEPVSEIPWAQPPEWSIYCSGPIAEPMVVYGLIHDHLHANGAFFGPERILNLADDLSRFADMAQSNGFMLARAPEGLRRLICEELDRQSVPHNVIRNRSGPWPRYLVRLWDSAFLCASATAEIPD